MSARGPRFIFEMTVLVGTADQHRRVPHLGLAHIGRDVADRQADAPVGAAVRFRTVHQLDVVQRHLPRAQRDPDCLRRVDVDRDLLAARQQVVAMERVQVRQLVDLVGAGE
jgi:hypothetical protein